jgi:hypothetical protein
MWILKLIKVNEICASILINMENLKTEDGVPFGRNFLLHFTDTKKNSLHF